LASINATVRRIAYFDMIVGGVIVLVLAMVGVAAVRANLRPLDEIEETAEAIADGHLDRRVPGATPHRDRPPRAVAEQHAEPDRDGLPRARGIRGGGAPVERSGCAGSSRTSATELRTR
jgi:HAMP domain-containing protein